MRLFPTKRVRAILMLGALASLGGCYSPILDPAGDVARQQRDLLIIATLLMLLIIVPVIVATLVFAWKYRASNEKTEADYLPDWDHSTKLELMIWSAPLLIIICLGAVTWLGTHMLDPYRPIDRIDAEHRIDPSVKPLEVDVVAMDWKWLFFYPQYGIATVNEMALPIDRPVAFNITSTSIMNSFFVPAMAGQIYAMPGMRTQLHAVLNRVGKYHGFSANYSGAGFSDMDFWALGMKPQDFNQWIDKARHSSLALSRPLYYRLEQPSQNVKPIFFSGYAPKLFHDILNECVHPDKPCIDMIQMKDHERGSAMNTNDTNAPQHTGNPKGALFKSPDQKAVSPNVDMPRGKAPGVLKPGSPANRNLSMNDRSDARPDASRAAAA